MNFIVLWVVAALATTPAPAEPPGQTGLEVLSIIASPSTFHPGSAVTFSIEVKNHGVRKSRGGTAYLDVFKGDKLLASDLLWGTTQDLRRMEPGETTVVDFVWRAEMRTAIRARAWKVPSVDAEVFVVRAGITDPSSEVAQMKSVKYGRKCTYSKSGPIAAAPKMNANELKQLKRPTE